MSIKKNFYIMKDAKKRKAYIDDVLEASYNAEKQANEYRQRLQKLLSPSVDEKTKQRKEIIQKVDVSKIKLPERSKEEIELSLRETFQLLNKDKPVFAGPRIITDEHGNVVHVDMYKTERLFRK